jgi:hypothetical protein
VVVGDAEANESEAVSAFALAAIQEAARYGYSLRQAVQGAWTVEHQTGQFILVCHEPHPDTGVPHLQRWISTAYEDWREELTRTAALWVANDIALLERRSDLGPVDQDWAFSAHPVTASLLSLAGLPDDWADQATAGVLALRLDGWGSIAVTLDRGVVILRRAELLDADGRTLTLTTSGGEVRATIPGSYSKRVRMALRGAAPDALTSALGADPRSAAVSIIQVEEARGAFTARFSDVLVPLDPQHAGGELWRPTTGIAHHDRRPDQFCREEVFHTHDLRYSHADAVTRTHSCAA